MNHRVVITGVGCLTPVGNSVQESWESLIAGKSGVSTVEQVDKDQFSSRVAGEVKNFDPLQYMTQKEARKADRFVQFAIAASDMALCDSGLKMDNLDRTRVGVVIGSGIGGLRVIEEQHKILLEKGPSRVSPFLIPMLIVNMAPGQVAMHFGLKGPNTCVATACATGSHALGDAFKIIQRGEADIMLTGGTEAAITPLGFGGFDSMKALSTAHNDNPQKASRPFDAERDGFVMAEGCGVLILENLEHALKRGAQIYCEVAGYGMTSDATHMTAPDPTASGAQRCIELALKDAKIAPEKVDYVNAHGTSTPLNDKVETLAIKKAFTEPVAKKVMVSSTKSMTGHLLGAAGAVEAIVAALTIKNGIIPPTINYEHPDPDCDLDYVPNEARKKAVRVAISNSLGFGGHNVTLCFKKYE